MSVLAELSEAVSAVQASSQIVPAVGVVLGSGLGAWADTLTSLDRLPYSDIPRMPQSTVVGHAGNLCLGFAGEVPVACLQGRVHLYEGHDPERVVFGVRLLARLGCRAILLTNAAGGLAAAFTPGDLMLVSDHLNLMGKNPLTGPNIEAFGPRFPDMTEAYDPILRAAAREAAVETGTTLHEGVYAGLLGPTYETPAEIRMIATLGASAVGMSTVPEIIALRHMGVPAAAISCITNLAAGISKTRLDHSEVEATARATRDRFTALLSAWVRRAAASTLGGSR